MGTFSSCLMFYPAASLESEEIFGNVNFNYELIRSEEIFGNVNFNYELIRLIDYCMLKFILLWIL
jgi:hypothetical protein